ncbi:NUDIX hydrolase [Lactobacillus porci]|uniref:NUDIX hydrolase n=1 Tax=Lactobacillus porci TaxID=2012477 RepID=A0A6A8M8S4_9LACO|nr:NUDIX domain-containing protein [Lactobacillus porci]MST86105.1 NUDIX hydrolase [Lactobacillus porci]
MPELEKIVERPLITITNLIWSFNKETHRVQLLLVKRKDQPFADRWALPETLLRENESADQAAVRLIKEKIGLDLPESSTEQLATFTAPHRAPGERALALTYMTYLPAMPALRPGYGATAVAWFAFENFGHKYELISSDQTFEIAKGSHALAFDHDEIIAVAIQRIRNKLDYQPTILQILGPEFTLREAREVYAPFFQTTVDKIDNSNFRKTHGFFLTETGVQKNYHKSGRPPKLYRLKDLKNNILWSKVDPK